MVDVEQAQEAAMWVVVLAAALLAAARFASYVNAVRVTDVGPAHAVTWWSMLTLAVGLILAGLLGQQSSRYESSTEGWLALLFGILVLVVMPADPTAVGGLGAALRPGIG